MPSSSYIFKESNWEKIKEFIAQNQADIVLVIGVILIALVSFGLGRFSAPEMNKEPVVIEKNMQGAGNFESAAGSILNSAEQGIDNAQNSGSSINLEQNPSTSSGSKIGVQQINATKGLIIASKNSTKYHWPWCAAAKKIKPENQVWFKSEAEAQKAGFQPCADFQKLVPAGYKSDLTK